MVHRIFGVMLTMMAVSVVVAAQDRHADRALQERAIRLEPFIVAAANRYGVDGRILRAICHIESGFRLAVVSPKGARGPMQFMPATAARYGLRNPYNPEHSIDAAARYFRDLLRKFDGRVDLAVAAYNAGEGAVRSYMTGKPLILSDGRTVNARGLITGGIPPYAETRRYVRSVLALVNSGVNGSDKNLNLRLRFETGRSFTIDAFDLNEPAQKSFLRRASSFIEVP
jgi:soluble lytic murein transglycosylase-like protein